MPAAPSQETGDWIPTRQSLLSRLRDWNDQGSWKDFFETYWRLIYNAARKAGLTDSEAQDVVQETILSVCRNLPDFQYRPEQGSFKAWLLQMTRWRIVDQYRRRPRLAAAPPRLEEGTATVERVADPANVLDTIWEQEWRHNLMEAAVERVKRRVEGKQFQIFDLYVQKQWPVKKVAQLLGVSATQVYLAKHRVLHLIRKEIKYLETRPLRSDPSA